MPTTQKTKIRKTSTKVFREARIADSEIVVDGFTWAEIQEMATDSVVTARCALCQAEKHVEPDAKNYDCYECGGSMSISSPLVKLGLI